MCSTHFYSVQAQNMEEETELYLTEVPCRTGGLIRTYQLLNCNKPWLVDFKYWISADNECINQLPCFLTKLKGTEFVEHWRVIFKYAQTLGGYTANIFWCNEYILISHVCISHIYISVAYISFSVVFQVLSQKHITLQCLFKTNYCLPSGKSSCTCTCLKLYLLSIGEALSIIGSPPGDLR